MSCTEKYNPERVLPEIDWDKEITMCSITMLKQAAGETRLDAQKWKIVQGTQKKIRELNGGLPHWRAHKLGVFVATFRERGYICSTATNEMNMMKELTDTDHDTYRIFLTAKSGTMVVKVERVGVDLSSIETEDDIKEGWYDSVRELPNWVQQKLATLMVCKLESGQATHTIPGVGRRISEDTFWVFKGGEE